MESISQRQYNLALFAFILLSNFIDSIAQGVELIEYLIYSAPFLAFFIVQIFVKSRKGFAIIFLIIAMLTQLTADQGNTSAALFFLLAVSEWPKSKFYVPGLILGGIAIFGNYTLVGHTVSDYGNVIILYVYFGITYYKKWFPQRPRPMPHPLHRPDDLIIADGIFHGSTSKEIAFDLDIKESAVNSRLARMREKYPPGTTTTRMIICLYDAGTIPIGENRDL